LRHTDTNTSSYTTQAQVSFRRSGWKRMVWAAAIAVGGLIAFIIFGPDEQSIKERFEYYGVRDEMHIMTEISIDDGQDQVEKLPKSLQIPPPPANLEIEEETPDPDGYEPMPEENDADPNRIDVNTKNPVPDSESSEKYQVEMSLPVQASKDFYIIHMVRPEYPLLASDQERRTPVIIVQMGLFVDPGGSVTEAMVLNSNGSKKFEDAALDAVRDWKFGWLVEPGAGRWIQFPFRFNSPYFTPDQ